MADSDTLIGALLGIAVVGAVLNCIGCGRSFKTTTGHSKYCPFCLSRRKKRLY